MTTNVTCNINIAQLFGNEMTENMFYLVVLIKFSVKEAANKKSICWV